ncbi:MAG: tetratricopeptide repeat protein [Marinicellaceae bacterium]
MIKIHNLCTIIGLLLTFSIQSKTNIELLLEIASEKMKTDLDQSERYIKEALKLAPKNPEVNYMCGRVMGRQAGEAFFSAFSYAKKSLNCLKTAVKLSPEKVKYRIALQTFYSEAPSIAGGDVKLAFDQVKHIKNINNLEGAKAEIQYYLSTEEKEKLNERLIDFRNQYPEEPEFHYRHGLLQQEFKDFDKAFDSFNQSVISFGHKIGSVYPGKEISRSDSDRTRFLLNALYQLGRNAVFSKSNIQQGVDALKDFTLLQKNDNSAPPIEWAYLRLAQLHHLKHQPELMETYIKLIEKSDDKELQTAIRKIK